MSAECEKCGNHTLECDCNQYEEARSVARVAFYEVRNAVDCHENDMYNIDCCWPRCIKVREYMFHEWDLKD